MIKKIFVFGNEDLEEDNLPIRILPQLREKFPNIEFEVKDPNEEWEISRDISRDITVLDTAIGIKEVTIFDDLKNFALAPRIGMHDFDALANLRYLLKLGKIKKVKIIALPPNMKKSEAVKKVSAILR